MTVQVRLIQRRTAIVRRRQASGQRLPEPGSLARRRAREGGRSLDHALYTCHCGLVFEAPVSTSVGCPHCGSTQAW